MEVCDKQVSEKKNFGHKLPIQLFTLWLSTLLWSKSYKYQLLPNCHYWTHWKICLVYCPKTIMKFVAVILALAVISGKRSPTNANLHKFKMRIELALLLQIIWTNYVMVLCRYRWDVYISGLYIKRQIIKKYLCSILTLQAARGTYCFRMSQKAAGKRQWISSGTMCPGWPLRLRRWGTTSRPPSSAEN